MKKTEKKPKEKRSRWITFILYPDNRYHMAYLDDLKKHNIGFYIQHEENDEHDTVCYTGVNSSDDDETKRHFHVAIYSENARTASGFIDSMPSVDYLVVDKKINAEGKEIEVLSSNLGDYTKYLGEIKTQKLVNKAKAVNDINAMAHYFIHDNFECRMLGKRLYKKEDVKMLNNDRSIYDKYMNEELPCNNELVETLCDLSSVASGNKKKFISLVLQSGDTRLLKYVESHSYFVESFLI